MLVGLQNINVLNAQRKVELELETNPARIHWFNCCPISLCFDVCVCVSDVTIGLYSIEKKCMRDS